MSPTLSDVAALTQISTKALFTTCSVSYVVYKTMETYTDLSSDVQLNKISMSVPVDKNHPEKGGKKQSFDLTADDSFWDRNRSLPL